MAPNITTAAGVATSGEDCGAGETCKAARTPTHSPQQPNTIVKHTYAGDETTSAPSKTVGFYYHRVNEKNTPKPTDLSAYDGEIYIE